MQTDLTQAKLKSLLHYDPNTGVFTWKPRTDIPGHHGKIWNNRFSGKVANSKHSGGYLIAFISGKSYKQHRLAWLHSYGCWPTCDIDHLNGVKTDNRIVNLREATAAENQQNQRSAHSNNKTGLFGVCWNKQNKKFHAQIMINSKKKSIGYFTTEQEAHQAYIDAKRQFHPFSTL